MQARTEVATVTAAAVRRPRRGPAGAAAGWSGYAAYPGCAPYAGGAEGAAGCAGCGAPAIGGCAGGPHVAAVPAERVWSVQALPSHQRSVGGPSFVCPGSGYHPGGVTCVMPPPYEATVKVG